DGRAAWHPGARGAGAILPNAGGGESQCGDISAKADRQCASLPPAHPNPNSSAMKCRFLTYRKSERGIALVITLVMLAIVTMMAIVFLAVSRRERAAVKMAEEMAVASSIAEAALERAKAEAIARMA